MSKSGCPFIWLLGENEAATANNNAFYFWRYITAQRDDIAAYFVLTDTAAHRELVHTLPAEEQSCVVWKNSYRHLKLYRAADLFLVSESIQLGDGGHQHHRGGSCKGGRKQEQWQSHSRKNSINFQCL